MTVTSFYRLRLSVFDMCGARPSAPPALSQVPGIAYALKPMPRPQSGEFLFPESIGKISKRTTPTAAV
jgi:hypothetical protein